MQTHTQAMTRETKWLMILAGLFFSVFGILTIEYAYSLYVVKRPWSAVFVYLISGYTLGETELGMTGSKENFMHYRTLLATMSGHMLVGGLVVILGILQFIPSLRRKHPKLHRGMGAFLGLLMLAVCATSIHFLLVTPPTDILAGVPFYFILFGLALMPLFFIYQAILAIKAKAFRDHMVWMGLAFACFLGAPLLRFNYAAVGQFEEQVINRLVLSSSAAVLVQTFMLFALWLIYVGQYDLPARKKSSKALLSNKTLNFIVLASVVGVIASTGLFMFGLPEAFTPAPTLAAFALAGILVSKVAQGIFSKTSYIEAQKGHPPSSQFLVATLASAASLVWFANTLDTTSYYAHALFYALLYSALMELVAVGLAYIAKRMVTGQNLFSSIAILLAWSWPGIALGTATMMAIGYTPEISVVTALATIPAVNVVVGVVISASIQVRFGFDRAATKNATST